MKILKTKEKGEREGIDEREWERAERQKGGDRHLSNIFFGWDSLKEESEET